MEKKTKKKVWTDGAVFEKIDDFGKRMVANKAKVNEALSEKENIYNELIAFLDEVDTDKLVTEEMKDWVLDMRGRSRRALKDMQEMRDALAS